MSRSNTYLAAHRRYLTARNHSHMLADFLHAATWRLERGTQQPPRHLPDVNEDGWPSYKDWAAAVEEEKSAIAQMAIAWEQLAQDERLPFAWPSCVPEPAPVRV